MSDTKIEAVVSQPGRGGLASTLYGTSKAKAGIAFLGVGAFAWLMALVGLFIILMIYHYAFLMPGLTTLQEKILVAERDSKTTLEHLSNAKKTMKEMDINHRRELSKILKAQKQKPKQAEAMTNSPPVGFEEQLENVLYGQ